MVFALVGGWGISTTRANLLIMLTIGLMGYAMRVYDFPIAPVVIGLILGPMAETQLRRALSISQGDPMALVGTPIAAGLMLLALATLFLPALLRRLGAK